MGLLVYDMHPKSLIISKKNVKLKNIDEHYKRYMQYVMKLKKQKDVRKITNINKIINIMEIVRNL